MRPERRAEKRKARRRERLAKRQEKEAVKRDESGAAGIKRMMKGIVPMSEAERYESLERGRQAQLARERAMKQTD